VHQNIVGIEFRGETIREPEALTTQGAPDVNIGLDRRYTDIPEVFER
jgi:hypothetical protein